MSTAQETIQEQIDRQEDYDAIEYGIRSIKLSRSCHGASACHVAQIRTACQVATRMQRRFIALDGFTLRELQAAKKIAAGELKAAKAAKAAAGNARQLKLALAA